MIRLPYRLRRAEGRPCKIPYWGGIRYLFECLWENYYIKNTQWPETGINTVSHRDFKIIVSLTTFPSRIESVIFAIKSLMLQTVKPDKIILWLANSQFDHIPHILEPLIVKGLSVRFCDDLRSHKKYYYALQEQMPGEVVITYDDDIIYERDSIEKLIKYHQLFPKAIICNRTQKILYTTTGFEPFEKWPIYNEIKAGCPTIGMIPSTGAGCLYPYGIMPPKTFDLDLIMRDVLTTDDLWIGFNAINNRIPIVKTLKYFGTLINVRNSQKISLTSVNDLGGENKKAVNRLLELFPDTINILNCPTINNIHSSLKVNGQ